MSERPVRWAHLFQLDERCRVGSEAWRRRHTRKEQLLSAWRRLHELMEHGQVSREMVPVSPSSDVPLHTMLARIRKAEGKK